MNESEDVLSAPQQAAFSMARVLLVAVAATRTSRAADLDPERLQIVDFGVQYPRLIAGMVPAVKGVLRSHNLEAADLADLFARRKLVLGREDFLAALSGIIARGLADPKADEKGDARIAITTSGFAVAERFASPLSLAFLQIAHILVDAWWRKNVETLRKQIDGSIPDDARAAADLLSPLGSWVADVL